MISIPYYNFHFVDLSPRMAKILSEIAEYGELFIRFVTFPGFVNTLYIM
jgi:hypothetical protein